MFDSPENVQKLLNDQGYICGKNISTVVYLANKLDKPVLVEGPAGVGKTELAKVVSAADVALVVEQILRKLGLGQMRIITNNPVKRAGLEGYGLEIVERVPLEVLPNDKNMDYLRTKREKLGHILNLMG